jgi:hypothetical protein
MRKAVLATLIGACAASPAWAGGQYYYYHKAGVTRDVFRAEKVECEEMALGAHPARIQQPYTSNPYAAGAGAFMAGFMRSRERRHMYETNERRCMASKGYVRIAVDKQVVKEVGRLEGEARIDRMAEMAAAERPLGPELPE